MRFVLILLSLIYFIAVISVLCVNLNSDPNSASTLGLNGIGDYLAGFFSPLAFIWIAYGYILQSKQLKESISDSKDSKKTSGDLLNYQLTKEKNDAQPEFILKIESCNYKKLFHALDINLEINGPSIYDVETVGEEAFFNQKKTLNQNESFRIHVRIPIEEINEIDNKLIEKSSSIISQRKEAVRNGDLFEIARIATLEVAFFNQTKLIRKVEIKYLDRIGFTQKNTVDIYYSKKCYEVDVGHAIKPQKVLFDVN